MNQLAFLFPGQGAQYIGMGKKFYEKFSESKKIFDIASEVLDLDMTKLCFDETDKLGITEYTQPAILTTSIAILRALETVTEIQPSMVAGLSLGEYSALVANKSLSFEKAVSLVKKRGKIMQDAVPVGIGGMAAVIGLDDIIVEQTCKEVDGIVEPANYNCPSQIVISGEINAVNKAAELLKEKGAKRVVMLKVSGPFHSSLLQKAGEQLKDELENIEINDGIIPYISNVTAQYVYDKKEIKPLLVKQVFSSVRWHQTILTMIDSGVDTFVEIGPSKTLSAFIRKIDRSLKVINVDQIEHLDNIKIV